MESWGDLSIIKKTGQSSESWGDLAINDGNKVAQSGIDDHVFKTKEQADKVARYTQEAEAARQEAEKQNSFFGFAKNFVSSIPESFSKTVGQPFLRSTAAFGAPIGQLISGDKSGESFTPQTQFQKDLYGTDKPINFTSKGEEFGVKNKFAAPVTGFALALGDITPTSKSSTAIKEAVELTSDTASYLSKLKTAQQAAKQGEKFGVISGVKELVKNAKTKLVDFMSPVEDTLNSYLKTKKMSLLPSDSIGPQVDRVLRTPAIAQQFMKDGGFTDTIKTVGKNLDDFDQYLIAKQAIDVEARGIKTGRDLMKDQQLVKELAPQYEEQAQNIYKYSRGMLDYITKAGLISEETSTSLKQRYPNYVPLKRIFNEMEQISIGSGVGKGTASLSKQSVVQKLVGSEREIESPIQSLYEKTIEAVSQAERNIAGRMLASYAKLPDNPLGLTLLKEGEKIGNRPTISFLQNGVKKTFEAPKEIAEAAKSLNVVQLGVLGKALSTPVRLGRLGFTSANIAFAGANAVRDQLTAFINTKYTTSTFSPINIMRALYSALSHDELYDEVVRAGAMQTSFDIARNAIPDSIEKIASSGTNLGKLTYTLKHPEDWLRHIEDLIGRTEEFTRIQLFRGAKEALLKQGMSAEEATIKAAEQAREGTVNFARRGEWGSVLNNIWIYLNANIQGVRTLIKTIEERPTQTLMKISIAGVLPVLSVTGWNLMDPKRRQAYSDIQEYEKDNNLIVIPPNPEKDDEGKWNVIKIPISQEVRNLLILPRRLMEQSFDLEPVKAAEVARSLLGQFSPIGSTGSEILSTALPQAIKPTAEVSSNYSYFKNAPIVPRSLQDLPPEQQTREGISGFANKLGGALGVSPLKVEHFGRGTFGSIYDTAVGKKPIANISERFFGARGGAEEDKAYNEVAASLSEQKGKSYDLKKRAEKELENLRQIYKEKGNDEAEAAFKEIEKTDVELADKILDIYDEQEKGLTSSDKVIKQLGVENGQRAKFIYDKISKMQNNEEKQSYINDLDKKGLISDQVFEQLKILIEE